MSELEPHTGREARRPRVVGVGLAGLMPEILESVSAEDRPLAARALVVPLVLARDEDLSGAMFSPGAFDFLVVDGVVLKRTTLGDQAALELLSAGDILAPRLTAVHQLEARAVSRYRAHGPVSLAVIEEHFRRAAQHWPGIADFLHDRLGRQTHRSSMHLAMLHMPRVEDRVKALFADLAERFGRMAPDGIVIDLPLTHEIIGGLVGSRRPTVTLALRKLAAEGLIERTEGHGWKLARGLVSA